MDSTSSVGSFGGAENCLLLVALLVEVGMSSGGSGGKGRELKLFAKSPRIS